MNMDFCAIDFETANYDRASACSVAIVKVRDGAIVDEMYSFINQSELYFLPTFIEIHGITAQDTAAWPNFKSLWPCMKDFIQDDELCAHNASFDRAVFDAMLVRNSINAPTPAFTCSLAQARKAWPHFDRYSLDVLSSRFGISLHHHDALSDARACAIISIMARKILSRHC